LKRSFWQCHVRIPRKVENGGQYGLLAENMVELKMVPSVCLMVVLGLFDQIFKPEYSTSAFLAALNFKKLTIPII
jgi:hypothetical protein